MVDKRPPFSSIQPKKWFSSQDDSMKELPQSVYFRSYVLEANNHVADHSHVFTQFPFCPYRQHAHRRGGKMLGDSGALWNLDPTQHHACGMGAG